MALTTAQLATLKAAIANNATWKAFPNDGDGNFNLAQILNQPFVPTTKAWRKIPVQQAVAALDPAELDNLYQNGGSKGFAIGFALTFQQGLDCSGVSGPRAVTDLVTNAAAPNSRLALLNSATESMTTGQQVFGGSTVNSATPPTAISATLRNFSGQLSPQDVADARNS